MEAPSTQYKGKKSVVIYPTYFNSKTTIAHGRRIPKTLAIENPTIDEIGQSLLKLNLPIEFEVTLLI